MTGQVAGPGTPERPLDLSPDAIERELEEGRCYAVLLRERDYGGVAKHIDNVAAMLRTVLQERGAVVQREVEKALRWTLTLRERGEEYTTDWLHVAEGLKALGFPEPTCAHEWINADAPRGALRIVEGDMPKDLDYRGWIPAHEAAYQLGITREIVVRRIQKQELEGVRASCGCWFVSPAALAANAAGSQRSARKPARSRGTPAATRYGGLDQLCKHCMVRRADQAETK